MRLNLSTIGIALSAAAVLAPAHATTLSFSTFVSSSSISTVVGQNQTIGFAYAGNKFVGSVYYGTQLYSTDLTGASVAAFGAPVGDFAGGETYVSSSLGIGGFGPRDVYAGNQSTGNVYRFANDGSSQGLFVSGLSGGIRSIAFDPYGLYGNNMIVATSAGNIYSVNSSGTPTLLASVGEDAEGLSFAPQAFGPYAKGTLFVASEGSGTLRAISAGGAVTTVVTSLPSAEMVSFVPLNLGSSGSSVEGFYAASFPYDIQKAAASQFTSYLGDAIITAETGGHQIWDVHFNSSTGGFDVSQIGTFPAQPEDGIFVTADLIQPSVPEPSTYALMLAGLGVVGYMARRRRGAAA